MICTKTISYKELAHSVYNNPDYVTTNRKGERLYERSNYAITLAPGCLAYMKGRNASNEYFRKEIDWYCSGSDKLEDAVKLSKFWAKCSDDGETVISNYGKLLLHDRNAHGFTQFEHAYNCLINNPETKKAVMTVYNNEHAFISNDNPCTMFVRFGIRENMLNMLVVMRSNDIWYGTPYDVAWYSVLHHAMLKELRRAGLPVEIGSYEHLMLSAHAYQRNAEQLQAAFDAPDDADYSVHMAEFQRIFDMGVEQVRKVVQLGRERQWMRAAWEESNKSRCLKKHCGCVLVCNDKIVGRGHGDRAHGDACTKLCARDAGEKFYSDGCYSVHGEMQAVIEALQNGHTDWEHTVAYVTHGPCDACCKLLDYMGVRAVCYDVPYKTNYAHWPRLSVMQLATPDGAAHMDTAKYA